MLTLALGSGIILVDFEHVWRCMHEPSENSVQYCTLHSLSYIKFYVLLYFMKRFFLSLAAIPVRAMAPAAPVDLTSSGFVISWNVPDVNTDFLTGYEITIKVSPSRRKRQAVNDIVFNVSRSHTSFAFTDGKPFTNYTVSVDGLLSVNGVPGRVAALVATLLRTDEAGE